MKKEVLFLAPESVVVPDQRDTTWLIGLPEVSVDNPWVGTAKDMFFAVLLGATAAFAANELAKIEFFARIIEPFFGS